MTRKKASEGEGRLGTGVGGRDFEADDDESEESEEVGDGRG